MRGTIYSKIHDDVISKIRGGTLKSGDALLSTRKLATLYRCHRFTTMKVYQDLVAEGWIDSTERQTYRVSEMIPVTSSAHSEKRPAKKDFSKLLPTASPLDLEKKRYRIEFWGGQPDLRLFPADEFRRILSAALKRAKPDQFNYGPAKGLDFCVKEISEYLRKSRNLTRKDFVVTNGSQEALYLAFQAFVKPGEKIAVEKKGYPPAWRLFENLGAVLVPIAVDHEGLDTDDLSRQLKKHDIKMIYITPLHQYPTTVTLSPRRRQSLIQISEKNLIPILEDDYDHEFHYVGPPPAPLSAETSMGVYVCSFSKVLFPGARLGVIGCDEEIMKSIIYQKFLVSRQTDCLAQIGLTAWIRDGGFERHLRKMCRVYERRSCFMQDILQKMKPITAIDWESPTGGMSIWLNLNRDSAKISAAAKQKGVLFQFESAMDYASSPGTHLRIGFAGVNEKEISDGLKILKDLL